MIEEIAKAQAEEKAAREAARQKQTEEAVEFFRKSLPESTKVLVQVLYDPDDGSMMVTLHKDPVLAQGGLELARFTMTKRLEAREQMAAIEAALEKARQQRVPDEIGRQQYQGGEHDGDAA